MIDDHEKSESDWPDPHSFHPNEYTVEPNTRPDQLVMPVDIPKKMSPNAGIKYPLHQVVQPRLNMTEHERTENF